MSSDPANCPFYLFPVPFRTDDLFSYEGGTVTIYSTYRHSKESSEPCLHVKQQLATSVVGNQFIGGNQHHIAGLALVSQTEVKAKLTSDNTAQISFLVRRIPTYS